MKRSTLFKFIRRFAGLRPVRGLQENAVATPVPGKAPLHAAPPRPHHRSRTQIRTAPGRS